MSSNSNYRGRSPYHRGGRGFRGRSKSRGRGGNKHYSKSNKSSRYNSTSTTKEYKFAPQTHGNTTYATYSTVKDVIIKSTTRQACRLPKASKMDRLLTLQARHLPGRSPQRKRLKPVNWNKRALISSTKKKLAATWTNWKPWSRN
jgi:hypothetical protein